MAYEIKGDIAVKRTVIADRRVDQGMNSEVITGAETLTRHSAAWQALSAAAPQDVNLPDATLLPLGWQTVIHASGASVLTVKDAGGSTVTTIIAGQAESFTCTSIGAAAGTWYNYTLEDAGVVVATRYTSTFDATTSWGAAGGGYYTIAITAATHGRGTRPTVQYLETVGSDEILVIPDQSKFVTASGDLSFRVPDDPDLRFAGKAIFI